MKSFITILLVVGCASLTFGWLIKLLQFDRDKSWKLTKSIYFSQNISIADPQKTLGWPLPKSVTPNDIKTIVQNHEIILSNLEHLVGHLNESSKGGEPAKFVPALESAIKKLSKVLPRVKFELMIEAVKGIAEEAQDLAQVLSNSPNSAMKEVNAFIKRRLYDIKSIEDSHDFMERLFQVTNAFKRISFEWNV